jgi:ADP-heptose:LPS heptosyltransferase
MHLLESYALVSGIRIGTCFIEEEPIPLPKSPYITIHPYNPKGSGRQYGSWHEVIKTLQNADGFDYEIIQIGLSSDIRFSVNTDYLGKTNYNSLAYLIKHSQLHLGFDSLPVHLASYYDKKIVAIYAQYFNNTGPYFSSQSKIRLFEPSQYTSLKPIFQYDDPYRLINIIPHTDISSAVISLLEQE